MMASLTINIEAFTHLFIGEEGEMLHKIWSIKSKYPVKSVLWWYCCFRECWYMAYQLVRVYVQVHQEQKFWFGGRFLGESFQQWWFFIWEGKRDFFIWWNMSSAMFCSATSKINYDKLAKPYKHLKGPAGPTMWGCPWVSEEHFLDQTTKLLSIIECNSFLAPM